MSEKDKCFAVKKDGLWLMERRYMGIRDTTPGVGLPMVPTCLYSADVHDALWMERREDAQRLAESVDGSVIAGTSRGMMEV